jgi:hypothetical protein
MAVLETADFLIEGAIAIVRGDGTVLREGVIASDGGRIVFIGPSADLTSQVARRPGAMRIDASGCTVFAAGSALVSGASLDVIIARGDAADAVAPAAEAIRMEIAAGKIVRWEQELPT